MMFYFKFKHNFLFLLFYCLYGLSEIKLKSTFILRNTPGEEGGNSCKQCTAQPTKSLDKFYPQKRYWKRFDS